MEMIFEISCLSDTRTSAGFSVRTPEETASAAANAAASAAASAASLSSSLGSFSFSGSRGGRVRGIGLLCAGLAADSEEYRY